MRRWTETSKWDDPWFRRLSPEAKLFFLFLLDRCDESGVWERDEELATFLTGVQAEVQELLLEIGGRCPPRLVRLGENRILLPTFLGFQQPKGLKPNVPYHRKISEVLESHSLAFEEGCTRVREPSEEGHVSVNVNVNGHKEGEPEGEAGGMIPESLDTPEFREAGEGDVSYRKESRRKKLPPRSVRATMRKLEKAGVQEAVAAIEATISNGWTGIDPEWNRKNNPAAGKADRNYDECLEV